MANTTDFSNQSISDALAKLQLQFPGLSNYQPGGAYNPKMDAASIQQQSLQAQQAYLNAIEAAGWQGNGSYMGSDFWNSAPVTQAQQDYYNATQPLQAQIKQISNGSSNGTSPFTNSSGMYTGPDFNVPIDDGRGASQHLSDFTGNPIVQLFSGLASAGSLAPGVLGAAGLGGLGEAASALPDAVGGGLSSLFSSASDGLGLTDTANSLSSLFGSGAGSAAIDGGGTATGYIPGLSSAATPGVGTGVNADFVAGLNGPSPSLTSLASPTLNAGFGGGSSIYGGTAGAGAASGSGGSLLSKLLGTSSPISLGAAALGGLNSLNANNNAKSDLTNAGNAALAQIQPYQASGLASNAKLSELLGTGGNTGAADYGSLAKPFTPGDLTSDPGYQFQLQQGNQQLDRKQAASGDYFSGAALKAAQDYGQGLASTTYQNAFNRDAQQKAQTYGMYSGQSGAGQSAAGTAGNIYDTIGTAKANAGISGSNILNNTLSSLLSGSGAKRQVNVGGQVMYL